MGIGWYPIPQYRKKNWQTPKCHAEKMDKIPIPQLDPMRSLYNQSRLQLHPSSVFIYLYLYSLLVDLYSLLFYFATVLTCMRHQSTNERHYNTVKDFRLPSTVSQKDEKLHTAGLDDYTAIPHVQIKLPKYSMQKAQYRNTVNPNVPLNIIWLRKLLHWLTAGQFIITFFN